MDVILFLPLLAGLIVAHLCAIFSDIPSHRWQAFGHEYHAAVFRFDELSRKPQDRHEFLVKHGWPADKCSKRKLSGQRDFLLDALLNASSVCAEGKMFMDALKSMPATSDCVKHASFKWSGADAVTASYESSEATQQLSTPFLFPSLFLCLFVSQLSLSLISFALSSLMSHLFFFFICHISFLFLFHL